MLEQILRRRGMMSLSKPDGLLLMRYSGSADPLPSIFLYAKFGDKYKNIPTNLPTDFSHASCSISPDGKHVVAGRYNNTAFVWRRDKNVFTKVAELGSGSTHFNHWAWSYDGNLLAAIDNQGMSGGNIYIYTRTGDTFTQIYTASLGAYPQGVTVSADGVYIAAVGQGSPRLWLFKNTGGSISTLSPSGGTPSSQGRSADFSPDSNYLAVSDNGGNLIMIYKRSGDVFSKLSDPASKPINPYGTKFFNGGADLLVMDANSGPNDYISTYNRAGDVFTKVPGASPGAVRGDYGYVALSPLGDHVLTPDGSYRLFPMKVNGSTFSVVSNSGLPTTGSGMYHPSFARVE